MTTKELHKNKKGAALHRLKIIKGHIDGIEKMVKDDAYCVDIIHQSMAVQKALKRLDIHIMKEHLNGCVVEQIKNNETDRTVSELMKLYDLR